MIPKTRKGLRVENLEDRSTPATLFALDSTGSNLVQFESATPGIITNSLPVTGLVGGATESLVGLDFRPATGQLYALGINNTAGADEGRLYTLNVTTGAATVVNATPFSTTLVDGATYGFDFNPLVDLVRVVNDADQNLRVSPASGLLVNPDTDLAFAAGGVNTGSPDVVGSGYTNNFAGTATTALYGIDFTRDRLVLQSPPNNGTLNDVGPLGFDTTAAVGFDVAADGTAFVSLTAAAATNSQLATINLATGTVTTVGAVGGVSTTILRDIAVAPAGVISFAAATFSQLEAGTAAITLNRTGGSTGTVTVALAATGGTATAGSDFTGLPVTVTFGPGETTKTINLALPDDAQFEGDETVALGLNTPTGGAVVAGQTAATLTIVDNDAPPAGVVGFAAATLTQAEGGAATVTLNRTDGSFGTVTVTVVATGGSATAGADFTGLPVTVTFGPGETSKTITVNLPDDALVEGDETVTLGLTTPTGGVTVGGQTTATLTITDNDFVTDTTPPTVTINQAADQPDPTNNPTVFFNVAFSEPVTGFDASDVILSGTGSQGATATVTGSGTSYVVAVSGMTKAGPILADVRAGAAADAAGNASLASTSTDNRVVHNFGNGNGLDRTIATQFAVGAGAGGEPGVRVFGPDGKEAYRFNAFTEDYRGGVRVATADFNNDGVADVVVGTGTGSATLVRVIDGKTRAQLFTISPFEPEFTGGVLISVGDLTGDGRPDLVITPDQGGGPRVRVFDGVTRQLLADFLGIEDPNFRGGARTAIGDVNNDGVGDLVVAAGFGGGPRVAAFDGSKLFNAVPGGQLPAKLFGDLFVFEPTLRNGVYIAVGDLNGDGFSDLIAGGGPGGGPRVFALSGAGLLNGQGVPLANFFAGDSDNRGGVRLAVKNLDADNLADLVTGAGEDVEPDTVAYLGRQITPSGTPPRAFDLDTFDVDGGVFVG